MARRQRDRGTGSIRKLPSGRWQARVLVDGNAALRDSYGQLDEGTWVDPREGRVPFGEYADEWIAGRHDLAMCTKQDYEDLLRLHLKPAFGSTPLAELSVITIRRWWARASGPDGQGRAPKTYRLLRAILNTAVEDGLIPRDPLPHQGCRARQHARASLRPPCENRSRRSCRRQRAEKPQRGRPPPKNSGSCAGSAGV